MLSSVCAHIDMLPSRAMGKLYEECSSRAVASEERRGEGGVSSVEEQLTHVGLAVARHDRRAKHLCELLHVGLEAGDGIDDADEGVDESTAGAWESREWSFPTSERASGRTPK
jgi:hypothetical protein